MAIVETTKGPIEGRERTGVHLFAGIPYAAPPTGSRRFHPPEPHPAWTAVGTTALLPDRGIVEIEVVAYSPRP